MKFRKKLKKKASREPSRFYKINQMTKRLNHIAPEKYLLKRVVLK